jgi:hypothetical protein
MFAVERLKLAREAELEVRFSWEGKAEGEGGKRGDWLYWEWLGMVT